MLDIVNLDFRIAGRALLEGANASIPEGHKVALVGRNGAGKSTLLKLIAGLAEADKGAIRLPRDARLGMVAQEAPGGSETPLDVVLAADTERARLLSEAEHAAEPGRIAEIQARLTDIDAHSAPARAAVILAGLGFDQAMQAEPMSAFSGGWRMRVALAAALFAEPDLLLLDEPTNHLDFEAAAWLEGFLKRYPRTLLMVSHDRDFLNAVADGILHLDRGQLTFYRGDYDAFRRVRAERAAQAAAKAARQEQERKRIQGFIDRFRAKATKARQAQSRIKALARMEPIPEAERDPSVVFRFPEPEPLPPPLIALDRAAVGYGGAKPVLERLDLRVDPDDRIALLGANGAGKSTLVKLLAGRLPTQAGSRHASGKMRVGYFAQHQVEEMDPAETPIQAMARAMGHPPESRVRGRLGQFGFGQGRAEVRIGSLSGGEKARLTLALITHDAPHLLILDEPTNHLDLEAREALIEGLNDYTGAVILVSHDRHLVELLADRLWLVANRTAQPFDGDLDDYRRRLAESPRDRRAASAPPPKPAPQPTVDLPRLKRRARDAEALVARLTADKDRVERDLQDPKLYAGPSARLTELTRAAAEIGERLARAETDWLDAAEALEAAAARVS